MAKSHKKVGRLRAPATGARQPVGWLATERRSLDARLFWSAAFAAAALWLALAWPALQGRLHVIGDLGGYHLPMRMAFAESLARREKPYWTPRILCGYYLHGEGQVGMLHPWHQLLYRFLPIEAAFEIELLANYPVLFVGMWLWLRRLGLPSAAALVGALLFSFSGFSSLHLMHMNLMAVLAHLPWLLLAIDVALRSSNSTHVWLALGGVSLLVASQVLLGHPQTVWLCALAIGGYIVFLFRSLAFRYRPILVGISLVLGFLMGAAQWWPTFDLLASSERPAATAAERSLGSFQPINLLQCVTPYALNERVWTNDPLNAGPHELAFYGSALVPTLCIALFVGRPLTPARRRLLIGAVSLAGVGLLLALGSYSGPLSDALLRVPIVGSFRVPARALWLAYFGGALTASVAVAELTELAVSGERIAWQRLAWLIAVPVASLLAVVVFIVVRPTPPVGATVAATIGSVIWSLGVAAGLALCAAAVALVGASMRGAGRRGCH